MDLDFRGVRRGQEREICLNMEDIYNSETVVCNLCMKLTVKERFKCLICCDFDVCGSCAREEGGDEKEEDGESYVTNPTITNSLTCNSHDSSHPLLRIFKPEEGAGAAGAAGVGQEVLEGIDDSLNLDGRDPLMLLTVLDGLDLCGFDTAAIARHFNANEKDVRDTAYWLMAEGSKRLEGAHWKGHSATPSKYQHGRVQVS